MMKRLLPLAVVTLLIAAALGAFALSRYAGNGGEGEENGTEEQTRTVEGRVEDVAPDNGTVTLMAERIVRITVSPATILTNRAGNDIALEDIRPGFTIRAEGTLRGDRLVADALTVLRSPSIIILRPSEHDTVLSPFTVHGEAAVEGAGLFWSLADTGGDVLAEGTADLAPGTGYRPFSFSPAFSPDGDQGMLTMREIGSGSAVQTVALRFSSDIEGPSVKVFFGNERKDPEARSCDVTYPVNRRLERSADPLQTALAALLEGPTDAERQKGYFTVLPAGTRLRSLELSDDGVARADFSAALEDSAGSCAVLAIRSQITQTLLQFPSVREVRISIEGRTEEVLEP